MAQIDVVIPAKKEKRDDMTKFTQELKDTVQRQTKVHYQQTKVHYQQTGLLTSANLNKLLSK